ncbi:MAG: FAD-dependent oxidoreductase [Gammaproteobacteria bacterium]
MRNTDITKPDYFHKVVDCQWACPTHTNVPEYIRMIAAGRYTDAFMLNWYSNVFPGILGRTCDRPCEPACRRARVEEAPVAICRLKRVAADLKGEIKQFIPEVPKKKNGKRIALIGGGPASLTVARDLLPLGYEIVIYDEDAKGGGMMRSQIPAFRLPVEVLDEEVNLVLDMGVECRFGQRIDSLKALLDEGYDAVFVGTGAPRGRDLDIPGRAEADANVHIGVDWLASVAFGHITSVGKNVVVVGGGNTAMDCCRSALRLGGKEVVVTVRSGFDEMKAHPWEKEEAMAEDLPILNWHNPHSFVMKNGRLTAMLFDKVRAEYKDGRRKLVPTGERIEIPCDDALLAIGQDAVFPWIESELGIEIGDNGLPVLDPVTFESTRPGVFFGGDAALGPDNIVSAAAHGHAAAISIDLYCQGKDIHRDRLPPGLNLVSQKMGLHEWGYGNDYDEALRVAVPHAEKSAALANIKVEVELGYDVKLAVEESARCLNCDIQTVFVPKLCIECDACVDICPMDCINFTANGEEDELRARLRVPAEDKAQDVYVDGPLPTGRIMAKDENLCLHCGLCAERCPTGAWDMQKSTIHLPQAGGACYE